MAEEHQPPSGSTVGSGDGEKKPPTNDDERKPKRRNRDRQRFNKQAHREGTIAPTHVQKEKFVGRSDDLKGFIYDVAHNKGGVAYTRTTEEITRYVGEKYTGAGSFIRTAILTLNTPTQRRPSAPVGTGTPPIVDDIEKETFKEETRVFVKTKASIESTMKSLYDLIWGQCSESLRSRLRGCNDCATCCTDADSLALLKGIRAEMTGFRNKQYLPHSPHSMMSDFYDLTQGKHRSNQECYDEFNSMVDTAEASGATIGAHPGGASEILNMIARDTNNPSKAETAEAVATATQRCLAVAFPLGSDKVRCGTLVAEIKNEFLRNKGVLSSAGTCPTTAAEAYDYLCNYKKDPKNLTRLLGHNRDNLNTGVTFVQESNKANEKQEQACAAQGGGASTNSNRPKTFTKVCRRCGSDGHNSMECNTAQDKVEIHRQSNQANQGVSQLVRGLGRSQRHYRRR
jgi:hypothetical protein